ncbi:hypothetical protein V4308_003701 [Klebsiella pneumoniae]
MTFLKMLMTALGQALSWYGGYQARLYIETHFRQAGYDDDSIDAARDAVTMLVSALITALIAQILRLLNTP